MKKFTLPILSCVLSLCIIVSSLSFVFVSVSAEEMPNAETKVTILHTNDIHGAVESTESNAGYARIATMKKECEKLNTTILADTGDFSQGAPFVNLFEGATAITLMNAAGYDVATLGNHEFDWSPGVLKENLSLAEFMTISANTENLSGDAFLKGVGSDTDEKYDGRTYVMNADNGKKIGFFGLTTVETPKSVNPEHVNEIKFKDEIKTANAQVNHLKQDCKVDVVVALCHMGDESQVPTKGFEVAQKVSGVDVVLDGHSHSTVNEEITADDGHKVILMQEGTGAANVGKIDITLDNIGVKSVEHKTLTAKDISEQYEQDQKILDTIEKIKKPIEEWAKSIVSATNCNLLGKKYNDFKIAQCMEINTGNLIADAFGWKVKDRIESNPEVYAEYKDLPVVSIENSGSIKAEASGIIRNGDVLSMLPYPNDVHAILVTPNILYYALEAGVKAMKWTENGLSEMDGAFGQVSGMSYEWDINGEAKTTGVPYSGNRIKKLWLDKDGKKIELDRNDKTTKIVLACNSFLAKGGNEYDSILDGKKIFSTGTNQEVFKEYLDNLLTQSKGHMLYFPVSQNRVTMTKPTESFGNYDVTFTAKHGDEILANQEIWVAQDGNNREYYYDDKNYTAYKTDENGKFTIKNLIPFTHEFHVVWGHSKKGAHVHSNYAVSSNVSTALTHVDLDFSKDMFTIEDFNQIVRELPDKVTESDRNRVILAREVYNLLTNEEIEKIKTEDYQKLVEAEKALGILTDGWNKDKDGNWCYIKDGVAITGWHKDIPGWEGQWFYFNKDGIMQTGWHDDISGWEKQWFYFDTNTGVMKTGWAGDIKGWNNEWFFFDLSSGVMKTGWHMLNWSQGRNWFYFYNNGTMAKNTTVDGRYVVDSNGAWVE